MTTAKRNIILTLFVVLATVLIWEVRLHYRRTSVHAQPADRSSYVARGYPAPFTLVTTVTLSADTISNVLHNEDITAVNSQGDMVRRLERFNSPSAKEPYSVLERRGVLTTKQVTYYHKVPGRQPILAVRTPDLGFFREHARASLNCATPDPGISYMRTEPVNIGGVDHPAAVVSHVSPSQPLMVGEMWLSLELGCVELKSQMYYETPDGGRGITTRIPVSLTIGEPDHALFSGRESESVAHVSPESFEERVAADMRSMNALIKK